MATAPARLRKTFHYPSDDDTPAHLDEQEQEQFIDTLITENETHNAFFTKAFLAVPLLLALTYLPALFSRGRTRLLALLALTSLVSTAYTLAFIPLRRTDTKGKAPVRKGLDISAEDGPVKRYLGWLNGGVCAVLGVAALREGEDGGWVKCLVPGLVFALAMVPDARCCRSMSRSWSG